MRKKLRIIALLLSVMLVYSVTIAGTYSAHAEERTVGENTDPTDIVSISAGNTMSAAVRADGSVWTWGCGNLKREVGGFGWHKTVDIRTKSLGIAAGEYIEGTPMMAFSTGGQSIECSTYTTYTNFGSNDQWVCAPITAVLTQSKALWMWGGANYGVMGTVDDPYTGSYSWEPVNVLNNVVSYDTSGYHSAAVTENGDLYMWGLNCYGQIGNYSTENALKPTKVMENVQSVSLGGYFTAALKNDGTVWTWGQNNYGQLGNGTTDNCLEPVKILDNVKEISMGANHGAALKKDGNVWLWGANDSGQLGIGNYDNQLNPVMNENLDIGVKSITMGENHSSAIMDNGDLFMWGNNEDGKLGDGTTERKARPRRILQNVKQVALGSGHTIAVDDENKLWAWGRNYEGQLGDYTTKSKYSPVEVHLGEIKTTFKDTGISDKELIIPWDDTYLYDSTYNYNSKVAITGLIFSNAAYNNTSEVFSQFGYKYADSKYNTFEPSYYVGYKIIWNYAMPQVQIIMAVRGTDSDDDKINDVNSVFDNFDGVGKYCVNALEEAENNIINQLKKDNINISLTKRNTKYFLTGHSLGAACAAKMAMMMIDDGIASPSNVYTYTYAAPTYNTDWNKNNLVPRLFNIIHDLDVTVPNLPGFMYNGILNMKIPAFRVGADRDYYYHANDKAIYQIYGKIPDDRYNPCFTTHSTPMYLAALLSDEPQTSINKIFSRSRLISVPEKVDVELYDGEGKLCLSTQGDNINYEPKARAIAQVCGDEKCISIPDDSQYTIRYIGSDTRTITVKDQVIDQQGNITNEKVYNNVSVEEDKQFASHIDGNDDTETTDLFVLDEDGDKIKTVDENGKETNLAKYDLTENKITISDGRFKYDGTEKTLNVEVENLTEGVDYRIIYKNNIKVGTAAIIVKGINDYYGRVTKNFEIYDEGTCGENLKWSLSSSGVLTISGKGEMDNYSASDEFLAPWHSHVDSFTKAIIEDDVTSIGENAFDNCSNLIEIDVAKSVTKIGGFAFNKCGSIALINYSGTEDEWNKIEIANDSMLPDNIEIKYQGSKVKVLIGDVNGDGNVTIDDATTVQKAIAEMITLNEEQKEAADANGDGNVTIDDVTTIQKYIAEMIDQLG